MTARISHTIGIQLTGRITVGELMALLEGDPVTSDWHVAIHEVKGDQHDPGYVNLTLTPP